MYHFFVDQDAIHSDYITISGDDVNHIKNVLRMKPGETLVVSPRNEGDDKDYYGSIRSIEEEEVIVSIDWTEETRELPCKVYLFQGLPKSDKLEWIIQKAVELGVYEIIPVSMRRSIVKLDEKKAKGKVLRWQGISESAAKQSKRSIIPQVKEVMTFRESLAYLKDQGITTLWMPYENARGMEATREAFEGLKKNPSKVAIMIGPEGGFDPEEVEAALKEGFLTLSLGKRILRTETAGMMMLSLITYELED
ncbi:MAG: 16S rRNA (uracil(1498)-N(3))-methyltransferase [Lachnospiraceae bacterium]|nr:16S rRNA (uracil(1498)-N(3))-methyltransferase [Lachnospiraceae bacterium]